MRRQRRGRFVEDGRAQLERCLSVKRPCARGHLVQHDAEGPDVARDPGACAAQLFGRHVRQRADGHPGLGQRLHPRERRRDVGFDRPLRQPEVQHLHATVWRDHHVVALEVAVDHAAVVSVRQGIGELSAVPTTRSDCQRPSGERSLRVAPSTSSMAM